MSNQEAFATLSQYPYRAVIADYYDEDDIFQECIATLTPNAEYPDFSHMTVYEFIKHYELD